MLYMGRFESLMSICSHWYYLMGQGVLGINTVERGHQTSDCNN
uniref:Uncharacterized protein n=1 Tax=Anguilla anguilla TaxID=7936 RepID=A0A0E9R666_ANGAN